MAQTEKGEVSYFKIILTASLIAFILSVYPAIKYAASVQLYSFIVGFLIALINAIIGYSLNELAFKKSPKSFLLIVVGGFGIRIIFLGICLVILFQFPVFEQTSLISSVFFFYVLYMAIEIYYLHTKKRA
jgi:hypothetical protein